MVEKFVLSISMLLWLTVFKNTIFKSKLKSRYFDKNKKILIAELISVVAFAVVSFFIESSLGLSSVVQSSVEGLFLGWMASLAGMIGRRSS